VNALMESAQSYPDWKAPAEDGQILIWPEPSEILSQTLQNHKQLSSNHSVRLAGVPLNELRKKQRALLGHSDDAQPLIATGHQTELIHPGVWVKHVLINAVARATNGVAMQFAVDTDAPKHLSLRWPGQSMPITDDSRITTAAWSGMLDAPSPNYLAKLADHFLDAAHGWDFQSLVPTVIAALRPESRETEKLSPALVKANHVLDQSLGLSHQPALVSPMLLSAPYLVFVHHLMSDAANFARIYNDALARYRTAHKTKSLSRPMPDLFTGPGSVEAPFWLDNLADGSRQRPSVFPTDNGFILELVGGEEFEFSTAGYGVESAKRLGEWLRALQYRLAPRALTLTTYIRLLIADNFVHGIGGGRYDQVSDDIIRNYFKLEPPAFSVTTATMFFPGAIQRQRVCVPCVLQEGHRLKHAVLGDRKRELVAHIASAPRGSMERQTAFLSMHRERNAQLAMNPLITQWEQKLRDTEQQESEDDTLFDRELYYALQTRHRLIEMIERYDVQFSNPA
jgi:hypothetical protein